MSHHKKEIVVNLTVLKPQNGFALINHIAKLMREANYTAQEIKDYMKEVYQNPAGHQNGASQAMNASKKWVKFQS